MIYRGDIDGLRAVAVVMVVLCHIFPDALPSGFVGVDVFFVISGYLITRILHDELKAGTYTLAGFYERRVRRILPALFVVCAASLIVAWFLFLPDEMKSFGKSLAATMLFGSNFVFRAEEGYFGMENMLKPLLHTWSLAVEEQFYILYPLFLGWLMRKKAHWSLLNVTSFVLVASFILNIAFVYTGDPEGAFFLFPMRAWELLAGAWVALYTAEKGIPHKWLKPLNMIGFVLLVAGFVVSIPEKEFPGFYALLPVLGTSLLIYTGSVAQPTWINRVFLGNRVMTGIGKISYSLYLWHWPLLVFVSYYALSDPSVAAKIGVLIGSFILAYLSWRFVEQPFRGRDHAIPRIRLFKLAGAAGLVIALCGVGLIATKGARFKFDPALLAYNDADVSGNYEQWTSGPNETSYIMNPAPDAPAPTILVWGDSHAAAIGPALGTYAKNHTINGAVIEGNNCFLMPDDAKKIADTGPCGEATAKTLDFLSEHKEIHTVILANRWAEHLKFWYKHSLPRDEAIALRIKSLGEVVDVLRKQGKRVIILAQVPQVLVGGEDIPSIAARIRLYGLPKDLRPTVAQYEEQQQDMWPIYKAMEKRGAAIVYPRPAMCGETHCDIEDKDGIFYYDDDHLSQYGAIRLTPLFEKIIGR